MSKKRFQTQAPGSIRIPPGYDYALLVGVDRDGDPRDNTHHVGWLDLATGEVRTGGPYGRITATARHDKLAAVLRRYVDTGRIDKTDQGSVEESVRSVRPSEGKS